MEEEKKKLIEKYRDEATNYCLNTIFPSLNNNNNTTIYDINEHGSEGC